MRILNARCRSDPDRRLVMETVGIRNQDMYWDIAADLHFPPGFDPSRKYPVIISVHPIGSCKEQTSGNVYGQALAGGQIAHHVIERLAGVKGIGLMLFTQMEVSRKSVADLIVRIIQSPRLHTRANLGVNKPGTAGDKPSFY
jgi:hypothetical protein